MNPAVRWSVAVRPMPSQARCGDAGVVVATEAFVTAVLIDGLGHGDGAAEVADLALAVATAQAALPPEALLRALDEALIGSRGAVASVLRIEGPRATFAGIGNVALSFAGLRSFGPVTVPGILGRRLRKVKSFSHDLHPGDRLALTTDGVSSRLDLRSAPEPPEQLARAVIERWGKSTDDAGCVALAWTGAR